MDVITDMIVRIKNATLSRKELVVFEHSKLAVAVVGVLERAGYVEALPKKSRKVLKQIEAKLVYEGDSPRFKDAKRLSKPSKRMYTKVKNVTPVKNGFGSVILSTPKGILTDAEARKEKVGGEVLFEVW